MKTQIIHLQRSAPDKPALGAPCNGCGICCLAETCPAGRLLFLKITGPCPALEWHAEARHYRCGLVTAPARHLRWLPSFCQPPATRLFRRWIAAGSACDSSVESLLPER